MTKPDTRYGDDDAVSELLEAVARPGYQHVFVHHEGTDSGHFEWQKVIE